MYEILKNASRFKPLSTKDLIEQEVGELNNVIEVGGGEGGFMFALKRQLKNLGYAPEYWEVEMDVSVDHSLSYLAQGVRLIPGKIRNVQELLPEADILFINAPSLFPRDFQSSLSCLSEKGVGIIRFAAYDSAAEVSFLSMLRKNQFAEKYYFTVSVDMPDLPAVSPVPNWEDLKEPILVRKTPFVSL